jgi:hypothetical protein
MAAVAIDFGTVRTRLAAYDPRQRRSIVLADVPTLAYVPRSGSILVGDAARDAISADPAGAIDDLKERIGSEEFRRNRQWCDPGSLISRLLAEVRREALAKCDVESQITDCSLTVPQHFELKRCDMLYEAAVRAGFTTTSRIEEPVAAAREWERRQVFIGNVVVVCDIGRSVRISVLRRPAEGWRADPDFLQPPAIDRPDEALPRVLFDGVRAVVAELARRGLGPAPMLVVGGGSRVAGLSDMLRQEGGWPGEVWLPADSELVTVFGAVDIPAVCPECKFDSVPKTALACPKCGFPMGRSPVRSAPLKVSAVSAVLAPSSAAEIITCPDCRIRVQRSTKDCPNCGYPLHKRR